MTDDDVIFKNLAALSAALERDQTTMKSLDVLAKLMSPVVEKARRQAELFRLTEPERIRIPQVTLPPLDPTPALLDGVIERLDGLGETQAATVSVLEQLATAIEASNRSQTRRFWITLPLLAFAAAAVYPLIERIFG